MSVQTSTSLSGFLYPLDNQVVDLTNTVSAAQFAQRMLAHENVRRVRFACALQARGQVHAIADDGVIHALRRPDVARHYVVGVEADSHVYRLLAGGHAPRVPTAQLGDHADGGSHRAILVVIVQKRY